MRIRWMLASTILLSSCAMVSPASLGATLILKPQIQSGTYATRTVISPYTQASINHLILKIYTFDGVEHDQNIQKSIPNVQLGNAIAFSNLKANTTYRIKAYAYASTDESALISTTDSNSYTDIPLVSDDRPAIANLRVKLIDQPFNGQATSSGIVVTNGGYLDPGVAQMTTYANLVSTVAGSGATGSIDAQGTSASFNYPVGIALDATGNLYVSDSDNHKVRKITPAGSVSTLAGSGVAGSVDGQGTAASFNSPYGMTVDSYGNVYVASFGENKIRKITPSGAVSTFAGSGAQGAGDGQGTTATFNRPHGVTIDTSGTLFVVDTNNSRIRKIAPDGTVTTFAGSTSGYSDGQGTSACFMDITGIAVDSVGNLYVADRGSNRIRKVTPSGLVSTLAGSGVAGGADGQGTAASFYEPFGITVDPFGNVFVTDEWGHLVRKISSSGLVSTIAGSTIGFADGQGSSAKFHTPCGIAIDQNGNLFVVDNNNHRIRKIDQ